MNRIETKTFHFDLHYAGLDHDYVLDTGEGHFPLRRHTAETLAEHQRSNRALALLDEGQLKKISHFVEGAKVPSDVARIVRVTFPIEGAPLPGVASMLPYVPSEARRAHRETHLDDFLERRPSIFRRLGVTAEIPQDELVDVWADADLVADSPLEVAKSLTFSHPQLGSRNDQTAAVVMDDHIDTADDLYAFATLISSLGPASETGGWATIAPSVDQYGEPLAWGPGYEAEGYKEGDTVYYYDLNDAITGTDEAPPQDTSAVGTVNQSLRTSQDDPRLENQLWAVNQGSPDVRQSADAVDQLLAKRSAARGGTAMAGEYDFTLNNRTPGFGLSVPKESIVFAPDGTDPRQGQFAIAAKNKFLRTLVAYVEFLDSDGKPIENPPGWVEQLPSFPAFLREEFETASKKYISSVTAVSVILGIPMPTDPKILDFQWPANAASCRLYFGGIGTRNWDQTVDPMGILLTGIFQYGVPTIFLLGGAAITSNAWFKRFVSDINNVMAAVAVAFPIVGGGVATAAAIGNTKRVLTSFAGAIAGILVGKGLQALAAYITAKLTAAALTSAIPYVGFAFRMANMALSLRNLAETTIEVAISPATYTVEVKRQLTLEATIYPDPLHGTASEPAIWPEVARYWTSTVQYRNGTNYTVYGRLPEDPSKRADPVTVTFPELPGGGQFQAGFGVYSETDWLAGRWTSAWLDAVAPEGSGGVLAISGQIQEQLVPLTPQTQYLYEQKLTYDTQTQRHVWHKGDQPTAVRSDLSGASGGHNLAQLVNLSLNDKAYMLGYTWQASGQNLPFCGSTDPTDGQIYAFQNISTLSMPESALKFPSCGFSGEPYLVYDQFGPAPLFSLAGTFQEGLDQGEVSPALEEAFRLNGYPLPADATVTVEQETVHWTLNTGLSEPTYDLRRETDGRISVFDYPTPAYSPNNFYVDPRSGVYHLRRVVLDEKTPFDMQPGESWGYFTEPHLDSVVVHPAGYVVGVSYQNNKMEIIQIPEAGKPDAEAEPASVVSGEGVRQGLLLGPKAVTVTPDGRLLVLETLSRRVQAFDLNGNPVATFAGAQVTSLDAQVFAPQLDEGLVTEALRERFAAGGTELSSHWNITDTGGQYDIAQDSPETLNLQGNGADLSSEWLIADQGGSYPVTAEEDHLLVQADPPFQMPLELRKVLDRDAVDEVVVAEFAAQGITLSQQAAVSGNGLQVPATYAVDLGQGIISQQLRDAFATRDVEIAANAVLTSRVTVDVRTPGARWVLRDEDSSQSYLVSRDPDDATQLLAEEYRPTFELHGADGGERVTYLDMAAEMRGYIYVLLYTGEGTEVSDYKLDLYDPNGRWLSRTPDPEIEPNATGVNGAKLMVSMWRTMYTLNFEHFEGPGGRTEPSISTWLPTTPEGEEDADG